MASLRNIMCIFILTCAVLNITSGRVQHGSENHMRIRRQVTQDEINQVPINASPEKQEPKNTDLVNPEPEDALQENQEPKGAPQENQDPEDAVPAKPKPEITVQENKEPEDTATGNDGSEETAAGNEKSEDENAGNEKMATANQEAEEVNKENSQSIVKYPSWTPCNFGVDPRKSCYDCHSLLICKYVGGLVKACNNPFRPYCNHGHCSPVPSAECV